MHDVLIRLHPQSTLSASSLFGDAGGCARLPVTRWEVRANPEMNGPNMAGCLRGSSQNDNVKVSTIIYYNLLHRLSSVATDNPWPQIHPLTFSCQSVDF